jgi:hypothetical protein
LGNGSGIGEEKGPSTTTPKQSTDKSPNPTSTKSLKTDKPTTGTAASGEKLLAAMPDQFFVANSVLADRSKDLIAAWRKNYVSNFTKFQRFNLLTESIEGYSRLYIEIQASFMQISASFQQIYTILSTSTQSLARSSQISSHFGSNAMGQCENGQIGGESIHQQNQNDQNGQNLPKLGSFGPNGGQNNNHNGLFGPKTNHHHLYNLLPTTSECIFNPYFRHNHMGTQLGGITEGH